MKPSFSFRPTEKLKKRNQFRKVYKNGRPVKSENFKLISLPNEFAYNRIGLSIESKKIPLSNKRVKVKRLLREIYRQNKPLLKPGFDMVVIAGSGTHKLGFEKTKDEMLYLFKKAELLRTG